MTFWTAINKFFAFFTQDPELENEAPKKELFGSEKRLADELERMSQSAKDMKQIKELQKPHKSPSEVFGKLDSTITAEDDKEDNDGIRVRE